MTSRFEELDLTNVDRYPFDSRKNLVTQDDILPAIDISSLPSLRELIDNHPEGIDPETAKNIVSLAECVRMARSAGKPIILGFGGHVVKVGCSRILIQLIKEGFITALATNGAGMIHDYELSMFGKTSEDVAATLHDGVFGFAEETGQQINALTTKAYEQKKGLGEAAGEVTRDAELSLLGEMSRQGLPATVHLAIGTDIVHPHPDFDGAAAGDTTARDFRILCKVVSEMAPGGVYINAGSAVIMPEIFLKAVTVSLNLGHKFTGLVTAVFDQIKHYRPKTNVLYRPTLDQGKSFEAVGRHEKLLPYLASLLLASD